jgi:hypothetical protein
MGCLTAVSPVPPSSALELAGGRPLYRKAFLHQCRIGKAIAIYDGATPLALAMLDDRRPRRAELCIAFFPGAERRMLELVRFAQLTIRRIADASIMVFARIDPVNRQACRMARLAGFRPGRMRDAAIWIWRGKAR